MTTSAKEFSSEVPGLLTAARDLEERTGGSFTLSPGLSKDMYYAMLASSRIQFNCALQDYVAFTMLEAAIAGCDLCYPAFRSFPECVSRERTYQAFEVDDALSVLDRCVKEQQVWMRAPECCDNGRVIQMNIMLKNWTGPEVNVWHQPEGYFEGAELL